MAGDDGRMKAASCQSVLTVRTEGDGLHKLLSLTSEIPSSHNILHCIHGHGPNITAYDCALREYLEHTTLQHQAHIRVEYHRIIKRYFQKHLARIRSPTFH